MSDTKNETKSGIILPPPDVKADESKEPEIVLPRIEGPVMNFNKETKMFWVGIPVEKLVPFEATLILDSMKLEYLKCFNTVLDDAKHKIQVQSPSVLNSLRNSFLRKTKKA